MITFILLRAIPGNPALAILGPAAYRNPASVAKFDAEYGFNKPWFIQYFLWLGHLLQGNLGYSWKLNQSVASLLGNHLPKTIILVGIATLIALVIALPIGIWQAVKRNKPVDYTFTAVSFLLYAAPVFFVGTVLILVGIATLIALVIALPIGIWQAVKRNKPVDYTFTAVSFLLYAAPVFFVGTVLILVFSVKLHWFAAEGPQGGALNDLTDWKAMTLPVATLALLTIAQFSRYMRSSVLDNITEDYVRTARAKGASERRVLVHHVVRNSLIPIATLLGLSLPGILAGALVTESLFNYPGMGYLFFQSSLGQDYPVLLGFIVVVAIATVVGSFLADIAYAVLDPRVRYTQP
jgi:peptide/nickel transport system permease protein